MEVMMQQERASRVVGPEAIADRDGRPGRQRTVLVMAGLILGMLLSALDQTVVGTAMPRIIAELHGLEHYAWTFTAYMLASTVTVPIYGKLSDLYGRKRFFLLGMALFLLGSALAGTSQSMTQLIAYRGVQGLGAGAMMPIAMAIVGDLFPPQQRGKWQGAMMAVFGLSSILGPAMGGWITDHWGWRWTFYVNMPFGALAILTAGLALPSGGARRAHRVDYAGAALLVAGAVPLLLAFSWAGSVYPWTSPETIGLFAVSLVLLAGFLFYEARHPEPIIAPSLFRNRTFAVSVLATVLVSGGMFGGIMYLPLFVQGVVGISATSSGTVMTPMMFAFMASSIAGGQVLARTGRYKILAHVGFAVAAVGMFLLARMGADATRLLVVRNMVVLGLGIGAMMSLFTIVVQNAFPRERLGEVTSSLQFFRSIGGTVAVAIFGTVMSNRFQGALAASMPPAIAQAIPAERLAALNNPQVLLSPEATASVRQGFAALGPPGEALFDQFMAAVRLSLTDAITGLFAVGCAFMAVGFLVSFLMQEVPLRKEAPAGETAADAPMSAELATDVAEVGELAARPVGRPGERAA